MNQHAPSDQPETKRDHILRERIRNLLALINSSPDIAYLMDTSGTVLAANKVLAERFGVSMASLLGKDIHGLLPPELAASRQLQTEKALTSGRAVSYLDQHDGRFVAHDLHPVHNRKGVVDRLAVFSRDITHSMRMENLLSACLRLSETASSLTMDALLADVLEQAEILTGSSIGFFHFVTPDQQTVSLQAWSRNTLAQGCRFADQERHYPIEQAGVWTDCIHTGQPIIHNDYDSLPHRNGLPPGHVDVHREMVVPIYREKKIVAVFGVGNKKKEYDHADIDIITSLGDLTWDIILRKGKEEALQQNEERYRMQIELAMDGILLSSPQWIITTANRSLCLMLGMKEKDIIGRHIRDLPFTPESLQECPFRLDLLNQGEIVNSDRVLIRGDNTLVPVEMRTGMMPDGSYQSIFRDITERKSQEQQLADALREKEVLLREVHHRVKNNLAAIISLMDMQRRNIDDAHGQNILTELSNRIRTMSLVHEKLYRADSLASIDFQDYTQALISHLRTTFGSPGIICQVDAPGITIPLDLASPCGLIVNELVTNALKYAFPEGKPRPGNSDCRIMVCLNRENATYTLTVADNGIGLPTGFDWTKTQTLGMILVRMLGQHQLRGQYVVDENNGTSFTLTFTNRKKGAPIHG